MKLTEWERCSEPHLPGWYQVFNVGAISWSWARTDGKGVWVDLEDNDVWPYAWRGLAQDPEVSFAAWLERNRPINRAYSLVDLKQGFFGGMMEMME